MMEWRFQACGLRLAADAAIPGLPIGDPADPVDVRVWTTRPLPCGGGDRTLWYTSRQLNAHNRPTLIIWRRADGAFVLAYDDGSTFLIAADGGSVWCTAAATATIDDLAIYLRGPVLGLILRLRGVVCLHASTVTMNGGAIALVGRAGAGKSTTAAGCVTLGCSLLADDLSALRIEQGIASVLPGASRLALWPDAAATLYGEAAVLPRIAPLNGITAWWDKRFVDTETIGRFERRPLPLAAIYVLFQRTAEVDAPSIGSFAPSEAFIELTDESYAGYAIDAGMRAHEFRVLGHLVRTIPIRKVRTPVDRAAVAQVCCAILTDYRRLRATSQACDAIASTD